MADNNKPTQNRPPNTPQEPNSQGPNVFGRIWFWIALVALVVIGSRFLFSTPGLTGDPVGVVIAGEADELRAARIQTLGDLEGRVQPHPRQLAAQDRVVVYRVVAGQGEIEREIKQRVEAVAK